MDLDRFLETPLADKGGLYLVGNPDSRTATHWAKVGKATSFQHRLSTLLVGAPRGLLVHGLLTVPRKVSHLSGELISLIAKREKEAHANLETVPGVVRHQRHTGRHGRAHKTEWFRPLDSGRGDEAFQKLVMNRSLGALAGRYGDSRLYRCTRWGCR